MLNACVADGGASTTSTTSTTRTAASDPAACRTPAGNACALGLADEGVAAANDPRAVTGAPLAVCSLVPLTGFVRDGRCRTGIDDVGTHTVCGELNAEFLAFSAARGNDLVTARGSFAGLKPGDRWCLCEARVQEAVAAGVDVAVVLDATNTAALRTLSQETLDRLATLALPPTTAPTTAPALAR